MSDIGTRICCALLMYVVLEWDRELWDGPRAGTEGALKFLGVDEVSSCNY